MNTGSMVMVWRVMLCLDNKVPCGHRHRSKEVEVGSAWVLTVTSYGDGSSVRMHALW